MVYTEKGWIYPSQITPDMLENKHYTPRGQIIEHLREKLRDAENQIDDMYRQKKRMVHEMAEDKKTL